LAQIRSGFYKVKIANSIYLWEQLEFEESTRTFNDSVWKAARKFAASSSPPDLQTLVFLSNWVVVIQLDIWT
jgi:hypothetical protein